MIAIAIIFVFFVGYGIEVFNPSPDREDACPYEVFVTQDPVKCEEAGGTWTDVDLSPKPLGRCDSHKCYEKFSQLEAKHNKIVFIISIIIGLLAFMAVYNFKNNTISTGIVGGSFLLILYGTIRYWQHASDILKFILLGIALSGLVWFAYKKIKE